MRKTNIENAKDDNRDDIDVIVQALPFFTASQQYHLVTRFIIIIIITGPKPAYGRQGLAGSWGQDTDKVSNFWVFLTSHFA